ncbi:MAG: hypothetical protein H6728_07800 [Myxococcales bacterium]|nr:hypothetical protein [Myxococcales bacterium]
MQQYKKIRKTKQRGAFFFVLGGLLALAGASKLAPAVHQAKIQSIGGNYAKEIATSIATEFLLQSGAINEKTWQLHARSPERLESLHPRVQWGHQLPPKKARALLQTYQRQLGRMLRGYHYTPPKKKPETAAQKRARKPLSKSAQNRLAARRQKQAIAHRKASLLAAASEAIAPSIYAELGFGAAKEISAAATAAKRKTPPPSWGWADTWVLFVLGIAVALAGLLVWHETIAIEMALAQKHEDPNSQTGSPFVLLGGSLPPMRALQQDIDQLDAKGICHRVDQILDQYVLPFAEVRQKVIERLGMQDGAEILVTIAFGERMLNRVWSAASDGYPEEARVVFHDALHAFEEAQQKVESLT